MLTQVSLGSKYELKLTVLIVWIKYAQKKYTWSKTEKVNSTIEFCIVELISLSTKFYFKQIILNFWTKFAQKG